MVTRARSGYLGHLQGFLAIFSAAHSTSVAQKRGDTNIENAGSAN